MDLIKYGREAKKAELVHCGDNTKIIEYNDIEKYPKLMNDKLYTDLIYDKKKFVYYDVCFAKNEIMALYVVNKKGKIISLFPYIHIGADPVIPYLLNKKPKKDGFLVSK